MAEMWGEGVGLRPLSAEDRPRLRRWLADRELRHLSGRSVSVRRPLAGEPGPPNAEFLIVLRDGGRPLGVCGLYGISFQERTADLGILLGEKDCWGRGYGPEALRLLLNYGHGELGLRRVSLCVHARNARAIRAYEKVGFVIERRLTVGRWLFGRRAEILIMAWRAPLAAAVRRGQG